MAWQRALLAKAHHQYDAILSRLRRWLNRRYLKIVTDRDIFAGSECVRPGAIAPLIILSVSGWGENKIVAVNYQIRAVINLKTATWVWAYLFL